MVDPFLNTSFERAIKCWTWGAPAFRQMPGDDQALASKMTAL